MRQTKEVRSEQNWVWFQNGDLKRETESLIVAAQNQSKRTNLVKETLCRLCNKADENIYHVVVVVVNLHRSIKEGIIT